MLYIQFEHHIRRLAMIGHIHLALLSVDLFWKAAEFCDEIRLFLDLVIRLQCYGGCVGSAHIGDP